MLSVLRNTTLHLKVEEYRQRAAFPPLESLADNIVESQERSHGGHELASWKGTREGEESQSFPGACITSKTRKGYRKTFENRKTVTPFQSLF